METMKLTTVEIIDWCLFGLEKGNPNGVLPLLRVLKQNLQQLDDDTCSLRVNRDDLHRFSGIEV